MRTILLLFTFCACFFISDLNGQNKFLRYGYSSTGVGLSRLSPKFKKEVQAAPWQAFHLRMVFWELQFAWGDFTYKNPEDADYVSGEGSLFLVGANIPFHKATLKQRKNYLRGIHIAPTLGLHYTTQTMENAAGKNLTQSGINIAPAFSVQFPFAMIDFRLNNSFYFGSKKRAAQLANYRGSYLFTPSISLQLDGLFEILGARSTRAGDYAYTYTVLAGRDRKYIDENTVEITETYETYLSSGASYVNIQNAFWYVSGKFTRGFVPVLNYDNATSEYKGGNGFGIGIGGRLKGFMADISLEKNNGFYAIRDPQYIEELDGLATAYPLVEGRFNATEIRGKVGFDILTAITNIIAPNRNRGLKNLSGNWVKFSRFHGGLSGGFGIPGKTTIYTEEGGTMLDAFFAKHPEVNRNSKTDIALNGGLNWNYGLFLNWEMGPVSLEYDWHGNHDYGWRSSVGISYLVILQELLKKQ